MPVSLFIGVAVTLMATSLSLTTHEEIVRVVSIAIALISLLVSLVLVPLWLKALLFLVPLLLSFRTPWAEASDV